jgi:hypothetical protein
MLRVMEYCVAAEKRVPKLEPDKKFNGDPEFKLVILGRSDSDFAKDRDSRRSASGNSTFLCWAPLVQISNTQQKVTLSGTESGTVCGHKYHM